MLKQLRLILLTIATVFLIIISGNITSLAQSDLTENLPPPQSHPLPDFLVQRKDTVKAGDYFDRVKPSPLGYLIWSQFPIKVYLEQPTDRTQNKVPTTASDRRLQQWSVTVRKAIADWNEYLPLVEITEPELADIIIARSPIEREIKLNPATGLYDIPRAIAAQTNYEFYLQSTTNTIAHRMTIKINPSSTGRSLLATVRHELGHALGIWGHSPEATDALYYSQVAYPAPISARDINTLRKIYQQPTRLGWKVSLSLVVNSTIDEQLF